MYSNNHAYRANHNTTTAMVQMYDGWLNAVESGNLVGVCLLDLSAAFDVVSHSLLIEKLKLYGFDDGVLSWLQSYLSSRSQCVLVNGCMSNFLAVEDGVPQGSILGPLLYTLFTNELPEVVEKTMENSRDSSVCCYADDTTLSCVAVSEDELIDELSTQFKKVT